MIPCTQITHKGQVEITKNIVFLLVVTAFFPVQRSFNINLCTLVYLLVHKSFFEKNT